MDRPIVVLPCEWGVHSPRVVPHSWHARCFRRTLVSQRLVLSLNMQQRNSRAPARCSVLHWPHEHLKVNYGCMLTCCVPDTIVYNMLYLGWHKKKIQKRPKIASFYSSIIYINFSLVSWLQGLRRKTILILNITFLIVIRVSQRLVFVRPYNWGPKLLQIRQNNRHLLQKSQKKILPRYRPFSKDKGRITTQ